MPDEREEVEEALEEYRDVTAEMDEIIEESEDMLFELDSLIAETERIEPIASPDLVEEIQDNRERAKEQKDIIEARLEDYREKRETYKRRARDLEVLLQHSH